MSKLAVKMMTLKCKAGHEWQRPSQRGKPPHYCPKHKPGVAASTPRAVRPAKPQVVKKAERPAAPTLAPIGLPRTEPPTFGGQKQREWIHVSEVKPGDWTHITGYRPVKAVKVFPRKHVVKITWSDGSDATYGFTYAYKEPSGETVERQRMLWVLRAENV